MRQPRRPQISRSGYQSEQLRASRVTSIDRTNPICGRGCAQAETGIDVGIMPAWETCAGSAGRCFRFLILSIRTRNWVRRWRVVGLVRKALGLVVAERLAIRPWTIFANSSTGRRSSGALRRFPAPPRASLHGRRWRCSWPCFCRSGTIYRPSHQSAFDPREITDPASSPHPPQAGLSAAPANPSKGFAIASDFQWSVNRG